MSEKWLRLIVVATMILLVELLCRVGVIPRMVMLAPSQMVVELAEILRTGQFSADIRTTFTNIAISTALSIVLGFVAGLIIYSLPALRHALEPLLASYYAVPTFVFYPIFITLFGVGSASIIAIAVLLAVVSMITATLNGLDRIPRVLRKTAQIYRMSRAKTALLVELPATLPYLFTGVKLSVAYSFIGVIASEFILSGAGIGYAIAYAYNLFENGHMYALILLVLVTVTIVNTILNMIDRRLQARRQR
ncbi:ABC transporter permease subunit [Bosea sp. (in: a-proteobacteria)]|jgi:NitT/TauT family transport system permease protein|uniref:ABC transporter permease n=1 Tax=Bosea sp. (in: a-proteobacteria) TaxID=1871050 RepID=UPI00086EE540|nr:ABC transporter permease subunit [Bosea sp. (in: a-proteobacteria)]MBN9435736.1 ABC transporter permease subunit [Bosea sp. (in: a-proteobacteria)]MBN9468678.1 ABC transporter permease subunit [Bosea sp. (in: a-proteobacteria)]ODT46075.1 MAG: nitrate ABC transporter permease [Methylobacterium sp. SCN 67-24]